MQAAFISYAVFLALFLLAVIILIVVVSVRTLLERSRALRKESKNLSQQSQS
jgi:hypothetical protein